MKCNYLVLLMIVSTLSSVPPITLLENKQTNQLHCVIANDSNSAITFVGSDFTSEPSYELSANICHMDNEPFGCVKYVSNSKIFSQERSLNGFAGHVFDRRWEGFRTFTTSRGYQFSEVVTIQDGTLKIAFSVRVASDGHIFLCDGVNPTTSNCYWFILDGVIDHNPSTTALCRHEDVRATRYGYLKNCYYPVNKTTTSGLTSLLMWTHFLIEREGSIITLYRIGVKQPILTFTDNRPIQVKYLTFRSPESIGLWKVHQYNFMKFTGDQIIKTKSLKIPYSSTSVCVAVYLKLCSNCEADVRLVYWYSPLSLTSTTVRDIYVKGDGWTEVLLKSNQHPSSNYFGIEIDSYQTRGRKWFLGDIIECVPNGVRKVSTHVSNDDVCCYMVKSGKKICQSQASIRAATTTTNFISTDSQHCPQNSIGSNCIPCYLFGNCDHYKYCEFESGGFVDCQCARGFSPDFNCSQICSFRKYGGGCRQTCDRCSSGCSHYDGKCVDKHTETCRDSNLRGEFCESFYYPVIINTPKIVSINPTNITIELNPQFNGEVAPALYVFELKQPQQEWKLNKTEQFLNVEQSLTINNLTSGTNYFLRISLQTSNAHRYTNDEFVPILNFTTPRTVPNPPTSLKFEWDNNNNLKVIFELSNMGNEPLTGYAIHINGTQRIDEPITEELSSYTSRPIEIEPAKSVQVRVFLKNSVGTSDPLQRETISPPPNPTVPEVLEVEATNLTIGIPIFKLPNEVICSLLVFVQDINATFSGNVSDEEKTIFDGYNISYDDHITWIAINESLHNKSPDKWKIVIGTEDPTEHIHDEAAVYNQQLNSDTEYEIIVFISTIFRNVSRNGKYNFIRKTKSSQYHMQEATDGNGSSLYLLILAFVIVICAIGFIILRRKGLLRVPFNIARTRSNDRISLTVITQQELSQSKFALDKPVIYQNIVEALEEEHQFSHKVKVSEFEKYVKSTLEKNEFERQHALFPRGQTKPWICGMSRDNKVKNRYNNLAAYDHTRVKLELIKNDPSSDYINANYIDGYNHPKAFIATQGPKESTLCDFWRMIWQENVEHIVMIANLVEGGKKKVAKYWPAINMTVQFGDISVKFISKDIFADYKERVFSVSRSGHESRRIKHLHFLSWPDHGVPLYPQSLVPLHKRVLTIELSNKPIVVHCSAGVGRTGTFILCDTCLRMAACEGQIDVLYHQFKLREQRPNMVDNVTQYKLVHMVLLQCLVAPDTSILCSEDMKDKVDRLLASQEIKKQMKYLDDSTWQDDAMEARNMERSDIICREKNRLSSVIPDVYSKVILTPYPITDETTTYINAIRVSGFQALSKYIITQYPLKKTVGDFWRLIHQQNISVVICLNAIDENDRSLGRFYPTENCSDITPVPFLRVELVSVEEDTHLDTFTIDMIQTEQKNLTTKVTILQLKGWNYEDITPRSTECLLNLYEEMNRLGKRSEDILICCYDGVRASGLFSALAFTIDKIKLEQMCDVCLAVRSVRHSRKEFVRDPDQFKYLYRCALEYVLKFELYSNFRS